MSASTRLLWLYVVLLASRVSSFMPGDAFRPAGKISGSFASVMTRHALLGGGEDPSLARNLVFEGMEAFRRGNVQESIDLFDRAESARPSITPYLWQRGLSYYYADRFDEASRQFRIDVDVNPLDVEEIVWDIASQYRKLGPDGEFQKMSLPRGQTDRRKIMASVYKLFRGEGTEHDLAVAGHTSGRPSDEFYSLFYLGLYCEARGEMSKASEYMRQAVGSEYAKGSGRGDYMTTCARIHCQLRKWA